MEITVESTGRLINVVNVISIYEFTIYEFTILE